VWQACHAAGVEDNDMDWRRLAFAISLTIGSALAQVADFSGTWQLNIQKSSWGKHPKPLSGSVVVEHREPVFKYSGTVGVQNGAENGEDKRSFQFDGAIDGKEHPVTGSAGQGTMVIRRVNPSTISSEFRSAGGSVVETAKTSLSRDGKTLIRELKANGPTGEVSWTEIYERQ
jgi:hypothetical protein